MLTSCRLFLVFKLLVSFLLGVEEPPLKVLLALLTRDDFSWYITLPPKSFNTWIKLESLFHLYYHRSKLEVTMADLSRFRQIFGETVEQYLARFKKARIRCRVTLPEHEFVRLAQNGLEFELHKKFEGMSFVDLYEMSTHASRYERLLKEEEQRRNSSFGTYYQDPNYELDLAEVIGKPMICPALLKKEVEIPPSQNIKRTVMDSGRKYTFDIIKASEIFDHVLAAKYIKLLAGHSIPTKDADQFCKWHGVKSHTTNNCVIFRNVIQENIERGILRFPEKAKDEMVIETDPFALMVGMNVVAAYLRSLAGQGEEKQGEANQPVP
ncbi:hypothetical protein L1049_019633 [Liquidambar formosana]|uniref:Retrotransposon gag domain-containing protein n=1 Tax=Liquidambar formosana TaxID=63359 RepID=A0AAP0X350_LIQFO